MGLKKIALSSILPWACGWGMLGLIFAVVGELISGPVPFLPLIFSAPTFAFLGIILGLLGSLFFAGAFWLIQNKLNFLGMNGLLAGLLAGALTAGLFNLYSGGSMTLEEFMVFLFLGGLLGGISRFKMRKTVFSPKQK